MLCRLRVCVLFSVLGAVQPLLQAQLAPRPTLARPATVSYTHLTLPTTPYV